MTLFDQDWRTDDPVTSRLASESTRAGREALKDAIWRACERLGPSSEEEIACEVERWYAGRWTHGGIVSACAPGKSGLFVDGHKRNGRGRLVQLLVTEEAEAIRVPVSGEFL